MRKEVVETEGGDPATIDETIRGQAPRLVANLVRLADGGYERVERRLEPAGTVMIKRPIMVPAYDLLRGPDGIDSVPRLDRHGNHLTEPKCDDKGRPIYVETPLYPDLPPDQLVEVSRSVSTADMDRAANQYLIDRIEGKPRQAVEVTGKDGGPIPLEIYLPSNGRDDPTPAEQPAARAVPVLEC